MFFKRQSSIKNDTKMFLGCSLLRDDILWEILQNWPLQTIIKRHQNTFFRVSSDDLEQVNVFWVSFTCVLQNSCSEKFRKINKKWLQWSTCFVSYTGFISMFQYINPLYLEMRVWVILFGVFSKSPHHSNWSLKFSKVITIKISFVSIKDI